MQDRPLAGATVVVTRASAQASSLAERLVALGAEVVEVPTIAIDDPSDGGAGLRAGLGALEGVDWLVLTSPNGANRALGARPDLGAALAGSRTRLAVVGPGTAAALSLVGIAPDLQPQRFVAEGLLEAFPQPPPQGGTVLVAQAAGARPVLVDGLRTAGWTVEVVEAYRTSNPDVPADLVALARTAHVVTFTSGSTVAGYVAAFGTTPPPRSVACIGPVTAAAAREAGLVVDAVADPYTIDGLVEAVVSLVEPDR